MVSTEPGLPVLVQIPALAEAGSSAPAPTAPTTTAKVITTGAATAPKAARERLTETGPSRAHHRFLAGAAVSRG
ncbi:hypothetical protein Kisp02_67770 [Kineosporia sp. NBRC 101731]|nr:hypothetical protein Kisp02_67770 [Kineosporia sp. NBRC 101731]